MIMRNLMSEAVSKARQMAEIAFDKTQSQFLARTRAFEEHDTVTAERAEKTQRLRAARLEREQSGVQPPGAANQKKRSSLS